MSVTTSSTFYLKNNRKNQYLIAADQGRYSWPQLGSRNNAVKLKLVQQTDAKGESIWKIISTESSLGEKSVLGAFKDSRDCYYWKDNYDAHKQGWKFLRSSGGKDLSPNDEIFILNISYQQYLVADSKNEGYITTDKRIKDVWSLVPVEATSAHVQPDSQTEQVFQFSVASGDPTKNSVILWTRLANNNASLSYEVAKSRDFSNTAQSGTIDPSQFGADRDYTVHVDVKDLEANETYFYRFNYQGVASQIGRCRTLPAPDEDIKELRLAIITCNDYSSGYFNAFYKLADADVDFVVHLGDFAYEYSQYPKGYGTRHRNEIAFEDTTFKIADTKEGYEGCDRAYDLKDFRNIYQTYRRDKGLQAAMENHTWMIMLDDHEIADDFYWDYEKDTAGAHPDHPIYKLSKDTETASRAMMTLCQNAKQAWREYVPYRSIIDERFEPDHPNYYRLYREFKFGKLVDFFLSDSRSYRDRPDLDVNTAIEKVLHDAIEKDPNAPFADILARERKQRLPLKQPEGTPDEWRLSMLGPDQKEWLKEGIVESKAQWRVWGNQTLMSTMLSAGVNKRLNKYDDWHGFIAERYEILKAIKDGENARPGGDRSSHFVVLTGDMHTSLIAYLKTDFEGALSKLNQDYSRLVGVEFMTPAVTSPGLHEFVGAAAEGKVTNAISGIANELSDLWTSMGGSKASDPIPDVDGISLLVKTGNPHIKDVNSNVNGYAIATFTEKEMRWEVFGVDKTAYKEVDKSNTNGTVKEKVSTKGVEAKRVRAVTYDPIGINLHQWQAE